MTSLFCRHNRFTADCSICSRGTVLESSRGATPGARSSSRPARRARRELASSEAARGYPFAEAGPYEDEEGGRYTVRLERVPGGLRLAEWGGGALRRRAPRLPRADLAGLVEAATAREVLAEPLASPARSAAERLGADEASTIKTGAVGASPGRSGELAEEFRVEPLPDGRLLRLARWVRRPGTGWEILEAPVMLPAGRYVEALTGAAGVGPAVESGRG